MHLPKGTFLGSHVREMWEKSLPHCGSQANTTIIYFLAPGEDLAFYSHIEGFITVAFSLCLISLSVPLQVLR